jgi:division protein CdvB (Snf7/Vps24/ESCRT-III family)
MSFGNKWNKQQGESVSGTVKNRILEGVKPQAPLKPRIEEARSKLQMQVTKLDSISTKMQEKDKLIFGRIVQAMQNHDSRYAKLLSNELSQIRRMSKMVNSAKLALEQIQLRLNTMTELGDVVITLSPAMAVIKGIQGGLSSMMPHADQSFGQISDLLGNIMSGTGQIPSPEIANGALSLDDEAIKIIEEATAVVEESTRDKFPDLPAQGQESRTESSIY